MNTLYFGQYYDGNHMFGGGFGWGILTMLFWVAIIVIIVAFVARFINEPRATSSKGEDALEIAKKRYAKGDITKTEFEQIKKDIK